MSDESEVRDFTKIKESLQGDKERLIRNARMALYDRDMDLGESHSDSIDITNTELLRSTTNRLRDREKYLLDKINKALERIDAGEYGICEECGEEISMRRLEARPVTTLCIACKEAQERDEKKKVGKRERRWSEDIGNIDLA